MNDPRAALKTADALAELALTLDDDEMKLAVAIALAFTAFPANKIPWRLRWAMLPDELRCSYLARVDGIIACVGDQAQALREDGAKPPSSPPPPPRRRKNNRA